MNPIFCRSTLCAYREECTEQRKISNQELLHAVVGLYDVCLREMTADCIYDTICEKWARTIVLVRDLQDTIKDMTEYRKKKQEEEAEKKKKKEAEAADKSNNENEDETSEEESDDDDDEDDGDDKEIDPEDDILEEDEEKPSKFEDVFSDTESEEEEEEEEEEDEEPNFTKGVLTFIRKAKRRRRERDGCQDDLIKAEHVGIENMLMGCASYEKKFVCQKKERVIHLTFIGVRKRARKLQMGRYLLSKCLDPTIVGHYEAVVVHADHAAVQFFSKFGFTDDLLLNSKWSELAEQFTQCTLMSYLPGFSLTGTAMIEVNKTLKQDPEVGELEAEFKKWQQKSLEAYQSQVLCMKKMQHEILQLKCVMKRQSELMDKLMDDNEMLRKCKLSSERELLMCKLEKARFAFKSVTSNGDLGDDMEGMGEDDINTDQLIRSLEQQVTSVNSQYHRLAQGIQPPLASTSCGEGNYLITGGHVRSQTAPYDHAEDVSVFSDIARQFKEAMGADLAIRMQYEVSSIIKAMLPGRLQERFSCQTQSLRDPSMVTHLYYCGTLEKPHRCQELLSAGFSTEDFSHGEYGHGLYFSKYPSKAAQFSALGKLVVVEVGLGEVETVTKEDRTRKAPSAGHDSIITPGRLYRGGGDSKETALCQEYVIFNPAQVLPICLLTYQAVSP
ncbi:uncharacterized protein LOC143279885 isoform X2 [Babylonia areolata]|uniref:uncharacterized protein LOC143279885 isoform X2 n=1 Tax=Babylonia areolata TaxID=304850 RepID=UPI003FD6BA0D